MSGVGRRRSVAVPAAAAARRLPQGGSVLVLALWTLFVLSMLAVAVARLAASDVDLARRMRGRTTAYYMARAGVERAILWVAAYTNAWDGRVSDEKTFRNVRLGPGVYSVSVERLASPGRGESICYGVEGEEGKVNVNKADAALLAAIVRVAGGQTEPLAAEIAASIVDWRDADDAELTGGAEASYYRRQSPPYSCPNQDFRSLHELLLVKGVKPDVFVKILPHLTLFGSGKINLNVASRAVLLSVAEAAGGGLSSAGESLAGKLVAFQEAGCLFREATASAMTSELDRFASLNPDEKGLFAAMMRYATIRSTCFGGTAEGRAGILGGPVGETRRIAFVVDRESLKTLGWHEY